MTKRHSLIKFAKEYLQDDRYTIVDIGAAGGVQNRWLRVKEFINCVYVEPDRKAMDALKNGSSEQDSYIPQFLGQHTGESVIFETKSGVCSSNFQPNTQFLEKFSNPERFQVVSTSRIKVSSLDEALGQNELTDVDFLKIDTQGSELSILQGSTKSLEGVLGVEVEVEFVPLYKGQPLFSEVHEFLVQHGFSLFDLQRHFWRRTKGNLHECFKGQLIWADALYLRNIDDLLTCLNRGAVGGTARSKLCKMVFTCLQFGYSDYAAEFLEAANSLGFEEEVTALNELLSTYAVNAKRSPKFKGRHRIASILETISTWLKHSELNADDSFLGN